jgi:hypothetical protein
MGVLAQPSSNGEKYLKSTLMEAEQLLPENLLLWRGSI